MSAMLIHAAGESAREALELPHNTHAVALAVTTQQELQSIMNRLHAEGVPFRPIVEVGGEYDGQLMAVGIIPCTKDKVKKIVSNLPLIKEAAGVRLVEHPA